MPAASSIIGQCPACCECPEPVVQWDSVAISKSKCGYPEFSGGESTPPKIYLKATFDNVWITGNVEFESLAGPINGVSEYDPEDCNDICPRTLVVPMVPRTGSTADPFTFAHLFFFENPFPRLRDGFTFIFPSDVDCGLGADASDNENFTTVDPEGGHTATTWEYETLDDEFNVQLGSVNLSDEYTTALLLDILSNTAASFPNTWTGVAGSFLDIDETELNATIRRARYRFRFPAPLVGGGTCYKVEWVERFTPDDEEAEIVDTPRCAIWDGIIPTGYDREDPETWPILSDGINPYFELNEPEEPGEITLAEITFTCFGCGEGCP